jgi:hypothetical protein
VTENGRTLTVSLAGRFEVIAVGSRRRNGDGWAASRRMMGRQCCSLKTCASDGRIFEQGRWRSTSIGSVRWYCEGQGMEETYSKKFDLGRSGDVTLHLFKGNKRMHLVFELESEGLDKTGVNALIDALKKVREKMNR